MNIGIDIDGVLTDDDRYITDHMTKFLYDNKLGVMPRPTAYEQKSDITREQMKEYDKLYFYKYFTVSKPREYAAEVIRKLKNSGHKIFIITARYRTATDTPMGEFVRRKTKKWLRKNKICYDEIVFTTSPKIEAVTKNKIDFMIEDSPVVIPQILPYTKVLCFDTQYNNHLKHENLTRVYSWYDLLAKFELLTKN